MALNGTAVHVEKVVRIAQRCGEDQALDAAARAEKQWRDAWRWDTDGSLIIEGRLPAELGALIVKAVEAATLPPLETPATPEDVTAVTPPTQDTLVQRLADALFAVAKSFLATSYREGPRRIQGSGLLTSHFERIQGSGLLTSHFERIQGSGLLTFHFEPCARGPLSKTKMKSE